VYRFGLFCQEHPARSFLHSSICTLQSSLLLTTKSRRVPQVRARVGENWDLLLRAVGAWRPLVAYPVNQSLPRLTRLAPNQSA
jgi:hypothetical protein